MLKPDHATIIDFLEGVLDRGVYHLLSSDPLAKSGVGMHGWTHADIDLTLEWIDREQSRRRNIYYQLNTPADTQAKKATKKELKWLHGCAVDLDLPAGADRSQWIADAAARVKSCPAIDGTPTVIMSGNGVQAIWLFEKPLKATPATIASVEALNLKLAARFDAPPGTHNCDRVLRVPGTRNYPNAVKIAKGWTPVDATLLHASPDGFIVDDFRALACSSVAPAAKARKSARRVDYTVHEYVDYSPFLFKDLEDYAPQLPGQISLKLKNSGDRSAACYVFLRETALFIAHELKCAVAELADDRDVLKNISELAWQSGEYYVDCNAMLGHYDDSPYGAAMMGYDLQRVMADLIDAKAGYSPASHTRATQKAANHNVASRPMADVAPHEARKLFIDLVQSHTPSCDLPNVRYAGRDVPSPNQSVTESNLREILRRSGIVPHLDVMRDSVTFSIALDPNEGDLLARNFERALCHTHPSNRARAEMALVIDAVSGYGMLARDAVNSHIEAIAMDNHLHPLEIYCRRTPWDGVPRMSDVADCLTTDNPLVNRYLEIYFLQCAAVIKSLETFKRHGTGEQIASVVILEGPQRIGKTRFWQAVAPPGMQSKGTVMNIGGNREEDSKRACLSGLVCIVDEFGATQNKSEREALKNFLSERFDEFRPAFARYPISKPRMTVFVGTSNEFVLDDHTGSSRYLPLQITAVDMQRLASIDLQQVYAEAYARVVVNGEPWWPDNETLRATEIASVDMQMDEVEADTLDAYYNGVTASHTERWLNISAIAELLALRPSRMTFKTLRRNLKDRGVVRREQVQLAGGQRLKRVFSFPVLPEKYQLLTSR
ncbi:MAG: VapE domain-containing protein [Kiritimatiellia bacterium]|jgi:hypothetical protein